MYSFPTESLGRLIFFTDLDGTLLDHESYSWEAAGPALGRISDEHLPWILTTSKTLAELKGLAQELHNNYPCILENGAGIAWPLAGEPGRYELQALSLVRDAILARLEPLRRDFIFRSCSQMTRGEFAELTGLEPGQAELALQREFTEPLVWKDSPDRLQEFCTLLKAQGVSVLRGGRFLHLLGEADKGRAMDRVADRWAAGRSGCKTVALGDSQNDVAMLARADYAIVVRSLHHEPPEFVASGEKILTTKPGPAGWNEAVLDLLDRLNEQR